MNDRKNDNKELLKTIGEQTLPLLPDRNKHKIELLRKELSANSATPASQPPETENNKGPSSVFSFPKGTLFIDRRMAPTPGKAIRNKAVQNIEAELLKKRIAELRSLQQELPSDEPLFNDVLKEFGLLESSEEESMQKLAQNNSYKRRIQQRKLKPIISETQLKSSNGNHEFFSIEKVTLLSVQGKQSKSLLDPFED